MNHFDADAGSDPIKARILVSEPPRNAEISLRHGPNFDATEKRIPDYYQDGMDALNRVPGWEAA